MCFSQHRLDIFVKLPEWTGPAIWGAIAGAIALALLGFNWGGWVTNSKAIEMSQKASRSSVAEALTPYCVLASETDPLSADIMANLDKSTVYSRPGILEKAGWATPLGTEKPNNALARTCLLALDNKT